MTGFPRTTVGGVSLSRMIVGTNWFLGYSHCTVAKDQQIIEKFATYREIADILEVFFRAGVNTVMGPFGPKPILTDAVREAEQRTGVAGIVVSTPSLPWTAETPNQGFDADALHRVLDLEVERGTKFCMPHTSTTDVLVDRCTRRIRCMDQVAAAIREWGMIPGLSTHMPESIVYADESSLDVETYISIFNAAGYLMSLEVDWTSQILHKARKPVMTIKPMAAGQIRPLQAFTFVWNAIREQDMVTVGTFSVREAEELIALSLDILAHRDPELHLQQTRSKQSVSPLPQH